MLKIKEPFIELLKNKFNSDNAEQNKIDMINYVDLVASYETEETPQYVIDYWENMKIKVREL
jgi:hypothetical protein